MNVTALTSVVPADRTGPSASTKMTREDFMRILLAEINHQDPMKPVDNQEFLNQLSQLHMLEATTLLTDSLKGLIALERLSAAGRLIGMHVRADGGKEGTVEGAVERVVIDGDKVSLSVGGTLVPLSGIQELWRDETAA